MSRNTFRTRGWRPPTVAADLAGCGSTTTPRHASWLLAGGADLNTVMDRLGHTQIQTTLSPLYPLPGADDQAVAAYRRTSGRPTEPQRRAFCKTRAYRAAVGRGSQP